MILLMHFKDIIMSKFPMSLICVDMVTKQNVARIHFKRGKNSGGRQNMVMKKYAMIVEVGRGRIRMDIDD